MVVYRDLSLETHASRVTFIHLCLRHIYFDSIWEHNVDRTTFVPKKQRDNNLLRYMEAKTLSLGDRSAGFHGQAGRSEAQKDEIKKCRGLGPR